MGLLNAIRPKHKHSDPDVRIEAARDASDVSVLLDLAETDNNYFVRHEAFSELRARFPEQAHFERVARNAQDTEVRRKAIKKMMNEDALASIARDDKYQYIRDAAAHRLDELQRNLFGEKPEAGPAQATM